LVQTISERLPSSLMVASGDQDRKPPSPREAGPAAESADQEEAISRGEIVWRLRCRRCGSREFDLGVRLRCQVCGLSMALR
jgi:hypothetical protein